MNTEQIAKLAHEVNRAYCEATGDQSQVSWAEAPQWQKDSAVKGVEFTLNNPNATPEQSHESWMAEKASTGWSYGNVKDADNKTHPAFLPYDQLPAQQRVKDYLFQAVVRNTTTMQQGSTGAPELHTDENI